MTKLSPMESYNKKFSFVVNPMIKGYTPSVAYKDWIDFSKGYESHQMRKLINKVIISS